MQKKIRTSRMNLRPKRRMTLSRLTRTKITMWNLKRRRRKRN